MGWGVATSEYTSQLLSLPLPSKRLGRAGGEGWEWEWEGGESREGELEGLAVPSATVFLPVGRPSLLPPYRGLSAFQGQTRFYSPDPPGAGVGGTQIRVITTSPPQKKVHCFGVPSAKELPLRRRQLISGNTQAGAALVSGGAGADLPAGLRPIPDPA